MTRPGYIAGNFKTTPQERREICDLYLWGARVADIEMLYDISSYTLGEILKQRGVPKRKGSRPPHAETKRINNDLKSTRPTLPAGARVVWDPTLSADQLIRSSAHAQRDKRIAERQLDANTGSCPAGAS